MKQFALAIAMILGITLSAQSAELNSVMSYNYDNKTMSPGIGIGTRVAGFGVGYLLLDSQSNGKTTYAHIVAVSKDLYANGPWSMGIKGGAAYLARQSNEDGWASMYGPYVSYRLSPDFRVVTEVLRVKGYGPVAAFEPTIVQVGFRYSF